ncbi:MAG: YihY/virulence factor BrkB family protein [Terriglobia bacterium]
MKALKTVWNIYIKFARDQCSFMAASIAFFAMFSLFPLVLFLISALGFAIKSAAIEQRIVEATYEAFPVIGGTVRSNVEAIVARRGTIGAAGVIGLIWSGTGVFHAVEAALNRIWQAPPARLPIRARLLGLVTVVFVALLLVLSIAITSLAETVELWLNLVYPSLAHLLESFWRFVPRIVSIMVSIMLFSMAYRFFPNRKIKIGNVWLGAVFAGAAWEGAKYLFTLYLRNFGDLAQVYGSVATVVALMVWIYISAVILLLGAVINEVLLGGAGRSPGVVDPPKSRPET